MEAKIIAATFTTLAVIFAGMTGSSSAQIDQTLPSDDSFLNDLTPTFDIIDRLNQNPEPGNAATLETTLSEDQKIEFKAETVKVEGLNTLNGSIPVRSEEDIVLNNFNGFIETGNTTRIKGSAESFHTAQMRVNSSVTVDRELKTEKIDINGIERKAFEFGADDILLESKDSGSTIDQSNVIVEISSFSGDLEYTPPNELLFDGKFDKVSSGTTSFGN